MKALSNKDLATAIRAVKHCAAKNDVRYYFNGVALYFDDLGLVYAVAATNGHTYAVCGNEDALSLNRVVIENHVLDVLVKTLDTADKPIKATHDSCDVGAQEFPVCDGRFPDIMRVINSYNIAKPVSVIGFSPEYLGLIPKIKKEITRELTPKQRKLVNARFALQSDQNKATRIDFTNAVQQNVILNTFMGIMPVRL